MPASSKIDMMDEALRGELDTKIQANGFGGYRELSDWLKTRGFEIGKTALASYGKSFKDRLQKMRDVTYQAKYLAQQFPDDDGSMNAALLREYQTKIFIAMEDLEINPGDLDPNKMGRVIADLSRASVSQNKFAKEIREEARLAAAQDASKAAMAQGLGKDTADFIYNAVLGVET